ncbi:MAG TPA: hypothetical protein DD435_00670 [Cyanobacteria bacterium UBA8530]|nr:hypothetical protein [Cyanobacteria bacterium UBA8530]
MGFDIMRAITSGLDSAKRVVNKAEDALEKAGEEVLEAGEGALHMAGDAFSKTGELVSSGAKSLGDLVSEAKNKLLEEGKELLRLDPFESEITRIPFDANGDPGEALVEAGKLLESGRPHEEAALKKLSPKAQANFKSVADGISNDTRARQSLQQMLLEGRLGETLLQNLAGVAGQTVAKGIDRNSMLADAVQEIADPSCIAQQAQNTCGGTTAQILLARQDPAEYVRLVGGLASPEGKVKIRNGDTLERKPDWDAADGGRTVSSQLLQPAFMEQSNGKLFTYDNTKDSRSFAGVGNIPGMLSNEMANLLEDLTGKRYSHFERISLDMADPLKFELFKSKLTKASPGHEVPVMVNYASEQNLANPHWLLVTGVKDGAVSYVNPWGQEERMPMKEFSKHLIAYVPER